MTTTNYSDQRSLREIKSVLQQLDGREEALRRIKIRISQFVEGTSVPLQLEMERDDTAKKVKQLRGEVDAFLASAGWSEDELRDKVKSIIDADTGNGGPGKYPTWLWNISGIVGAIIAVFILLWALKMLPFSGIDSPATAQPTVVSNVESVASAILPESTPQPTTPPTPEKPPIEATLEAIIATGLPDVAPSLATTVTLLSLPICADEMNALADFLIESVKDYEPPLTVLVQDKPERLVEERDAVRALATEQGADLLVWCTGDGDKRMFHLETLTQRAAPEVYEPPTISIPLAPIDRLHRAVLGMAVYLRRDYVSAEPVLRTAVGLSREADVQGILQLLVGNAQTMRHDYARAKDTLKDLVALQPNWAFAWHNLGVAKFNADWENQVFDDALKDYEQARVVDPEFDLSLISIAQIYRLQAHDFEEIGKYENAVGTCMAASMSDDDIVSLQGQVCATWNQFVSYSRAFTSTLPLVGDSAAYSQIATEYWAEPLIQLGLLEQLYDSENPDQTTQNQMQQYLARFIIEAHDDVILEELASFYRYAISLLSIE